ncbi:MAG: HAD-IA family hydrolase [Rubrivivax sp.]|nr:HAD-IA family hydrolase [Rubrivivax sp.]
MSISLLVERYAVLLLDAYGVLVHSTGVLSGGPELIERLTRQGKPYFILTNDASRLPATAARRFQAFGLAIPEERIITSGQLLREYFADNGLVDARCVVLGPAESRQYVAEAGGRLVSASEGFDVLVIADEVGFPFFETVNAAVTSIFQALDREEDVRLVLPNPDVFYPVAEHGFGVTSGGVAAMIEAAIHARYPHRKDLRFTRLGKPEPPIFAEALRRSGTRDMVMVGDQLETDIRGARAFGLDAAWVSRGSLRALEALPADLRPTYRLLSLA